jgi:deoxycytidine triphosphate deaminase
MSFLTDKSLRQMRCSLSEWDRTTEKETKIGIEPFSDDCLTPVGYDLRVGENYSSSLKGSGQISRNNPVVIEAGETVLIFSLEQVKMPKSRKVSALVVSKVSQVLKGLSHISTTIDPDWQGKLLIAVHNHSRKSITLEFQEPFCTVVFFETKEESEKSSQTGGVQRLFDFMNRYDNDARTNKHQREKANRTSLIYHVACLGIIPLSLIAGYILFRKNTELFITTAGLGVALSQTGLALINNVIKK